MNLLIVWIISHTIFKIEVLSYFVMFSVGVKVLVEGIILLNVDIRLDPLPRLEIGQILGETDAVAGTAALVCLVLLQSTFFKLAIYN